MEYGCEMFAFCVSYVGGLTANFNAFTVNSRKQVVEDGRVCKKGVINDRWHPSGNTFVRFQTVIQSTYATASIRSLN